jgi:hypothetical protein
VIARETLSVTEFYLFLTIFLTLTLEQSNRILRAVATPNAALAMVTISRSIRGRDQPGDQRLPRIRHITRAAGLRRLYRDRFSMAHIRTPPRITPAQASHR